MVDDNTLSRTLIKVGVEWSAAPEAFECRLYRQQVYTLDGAKLVPVIQWRIATGYHLLTAEGERILQEDEWELPAAAVTVAENIRSRVIARIKARNSIT